VLRRPRPLHEPRRILESDARTYFPSVFAGIAIGLLLLGALLLLERRQQDDVSPSTPAPELLLEPVQPVTSAPLGDFGACVQTKLLDTNPDGAETAEEMTDAVHGCLHLLEPAD